MVPETTSRLTAERRDELVDALHALVTGLEPEGRVSGAATPRLDVAVARWSRAVPEAADVLGLVAQVRARTRADRSRRHAELLRRVEVVGVAAVAGRNVREALTDPLSGLATRARLEDEVTALIAGCTRSGSALTAVILDVDGLKRINDEQGHVAGDAAIAEAGRAIRTHLRASDRAFRYGGDEFALFLPGTTEQGARVLVDRIRQSSSTSLSAGVAVHSGGAVDTDIARWLSAADAELYGRRREERSTPVGAPVRRRFGAVAAAAATVLVAAGVGVAVPVAVHGLAGRNGAMNAPDRPSPSPAARVPLPRPLSRPAVVVPTAAAPQTAAPLASPVVVVVLPVLPTAAPVTMPTPPVVVPSLPSLPTVLPVPDPSPSPGLVGGLLHGVGDLLDALL